jgi:hypothetical protein
MAHIPELPADDPDALLEAVRRAAAGERIHLVNADGRRIADVVPPPDGAAEPARRPDRRPGETDDEHADRLTRELIAATGGVLPRLEHYQRVYASLGLPWPGDEMARSRYPVADS